MLAARHDVAVLFDGNAFAREFERNNEFGQGQRRIEFARFAVDKKRDQNELPMDELT